ncbi:MAG: DUF2029 domain-containing protein [Candidatus Omnitrophica bacterium]|nr:DUF2029 domain-containing protein [Candidatus Omnitrophota bacterium]
MRSSLIFIAFASLIINLFLGFKTQLISDTSNFYRVGKSVVNFENPYKNLKDAYPYPPLSMFISALNYKISQVTGLAFPFINRLIPILSFILLGIVIFSKDSRVSNSKQKIILYFFNPLIILVTTVIGQNDILVIFLIVLTILLLSKKPVVSGLLFAFASLVKIYPLFLLPMLLKAFKNKKNNLFRFLSVFISINLLFWLPFLFASFKDTLLSVFAYKGFADFGWGGIIRTFLMIFGKDFISAHLFSLKLSKVGIFLFVAFFFFILRRLIRQKDLFKLCSIIFISFLILYPNISVQYLVWVLPFYFLYKPVKVLFKYTIFASLAVVYFFLFSNPSLFGIEKVSTNLLILLVLQTITYLYTVKLLYEEIIHAR